MLLNIEKIHQIPDFPMLISPFFSIEEFQKTVYQKI